MGNRTTAQKHLINSFQTLEELPTLLEDSQCVLHKHEILICGGKRQNACYSYDILKNKYKFICEYPSHVKLKGHCVVKLIDNNKNSNEITLLSFGSSLFGKNKHTLVMKYVSVWSNILDISNKSNEFNNYNQWVPFTDNDNHPIIIASDYANYTGVRAVIGGSNNHLLFITYIPHNIRLSIEYDENNNIFQFQRLPVCEKIAPLSYYAHVCINDIILFFGGWNGRFNNVVVSKSVYKYSIRENKWTTFQNTLPSRLRGCVAILDEEDNYIHIIGGRDHEKKVLTHMKTKVRVWDPSQLVMIYLFFYETKLVIQYWIRILKIKLGWIDDFDKIIIKYNRTKYIL
ncbi:hypothetical protein RFI_03990 [Reticulomyxa filosa]|uniref:Kelch motif family protein n=1 Tax=Reticulomyxa filosa TaxID=46433 RepID=X6P4H5_RETFI|nr:hypothetical protein RFI_03990 [Reticulomyxa filosa]|eukprot:ETO33116.1 hypothetical protein RFI_03990 [Reticulomyxa filosa]